MNNDQTLGIPVPGWTPPPTPPRETITGRYVSLVPLNAKDHATDLFAAFAKDKTGANWTWRMQEPFETEAALTAWLRAIERDEAMIYFAYVDHATSKATGNGAFMSMMPAGGSIEIGSIMLGPALQRTRAGTEALMLMIRWAFDAGYRRVEWTCDPLNAASMHAAERLGFSYEALFRQAYVTKGRNRDKAIFAITDADWQNLKVVYDSWLDAANFAADGEQLSRLSDLTAPLVQARSTPAKSDITNDLGQPLGAPVPDWTPPPHPPREAIEGRYCIVEPLDPNAHAEDLFAANQQSDTIWDYLPYGPFDDVEAYHQWLCAECTGRDPLFHTVINKATGRAEGIASYLRIAPADGSIEVGHINFAKPLQQTRAGTEAMTLLMDRAFSLGYRRYEWKCNALNTPSRRLAQRLGMSFEGVFRQATITKGRNRDTAWYACIDSEWPRIRAAFDQWLDPVNFDVNGRQRESLSALTGPVLVRRG